MREEFRKELIESGYIRFPLPLHRERALEREERKVLETAEPFKLSSASVTEPGRIEFVSADDKTFLRLSGPTGRTFEPGKDYMESRRTAELSFAFEPADWRAYDRIAVLVKPDCPGQHSVHFRLHLKNEGEKPVPDPYWREGSCLCSLDNGVWNPVVWDFPMLPRDYVTSFTVTVDSDGRDLTDGPEFSFVFDAFELQKTDAPLHEYGWDCAPGRIACSMGGYQLTGRKTAVCSGEIVCFSVENKEGVIVYEGEAKRAETAGFSLSVLDFSALDKPGFYRIRAGACVSPFFEISEDALEESLWKLLNFIYCERCGFLVPGKHGKCHGDVYARHNGLILPFSGGWHDAGDMSQQTLQTGEVAEALLLAASACDDPVFSARLFEEGLWGLEYVLRSRFGDGYRATSVGLGAWSAGFIGDDDDVEVRVHAQAFQNFFLAGTEASAAYILREKEPMLSYKCLEAAKEDYRFAEERFRQYGVEYPIMWEHTLGSSLSQYYAAAVRAAAAICRMEKNPEFEAEAVKYAEKLLACQESGDAAPMKGYFRRSEDSPIIVHYTHQAREHCFAEAGA
ncbi:MAG: glycoside hydrolase family 9 protein, partial [Lachnospiraceae bacterium]|nr:glycoside hydrolase family 9 protein [Lachnospiraceae bacterium]